MTQRDVILDALRPMSDKVLETPTTEQLIRPSAEVDPTFADADAFKPDTGFPGWEVIAHELADEVKRLRAEIDRLQGGAGEAPLESKADWTHPLYQMWIEMGLDDIGQLDLAWGTVVRGECAKCAGPLTDGPYTPFKTCPDCQLCFIASKGHFAIDTLERAQERGPDA